jgi:hypothetical protein
MSGTPINYAPLTEAQRQHLDRHGWVIDDNHNLLNRKQAAEIDARRAANAEARRRDEERIDQQLAPRKETERHRWLADHPGKTAGGFEREAWPHVRAVLVADLAEERTRQTTAALANSGRYSF